MLILSTARVLIVADNQTAPLVTHGSNIGRQLLWVRIVAPFAPGQCWEQSFITVRKPKGLMRPGHRTVQDTTALLIGIFPRRTLPSFVLNHKSIF